MTSARRLLTACSLLPLFACGVDTPAETLTTFGTSSESGASTTDSESGTVTTDSAGDGDGDSVTGDGDGTTTGDGDGTTTGDGDGTTTGDGDGTTTGDGDGTTTGDGDGTTTGDGDGTTTGDGDGTTTGDGDGTTTGDGDGTTTGDGDGTTTGDGDGDGTTTGDGDGTTTGDGDGTTTGDGDGTTTGDGDGTTTGDGDGTTTGDGDGTTTGDGDGTTTGDGDGDGDGSTGDGTTGCFDINNTFTRVVPKVVLALDKSGSMFQNRWSPTGGTCLGSCSITTTAACDEDSDCPGVETCTGLAADCETRWATLHGVVNTLTAQFENTIALGSQLFPRRQVGAGAWGDPACAVNGINWNNALLKGTPTGNIEVNTAEGNAAAIMAWLPDADGLGPAAQDWTYGATPTHDGLNSSYAHVVQALAGDPNTPGFVILVTDGAANCDWVNNSVANDIMGTYDSRLGDDSNAIAGPGLVDSAFVNDGIPTYVVGIDMTQGAETCPLQTFFCPDPWKEQGTCSITTTALCDEDTDCPGAETCTVDPVASEIFPYDKLNDLAIDGGRSKMGLEKFYNATDPAALLSELNTIILGLQSCVVPLSIAPPFGNNIIVSFDNGVTTVSVPWIGLTGDCSIDDGWDYVNPACDPNTPGDPDCDAIELCGSFCDDLIAAPTAEVDVIYKCESA